MKKLLALLLLSAALVAGCGSSTEDVWGGYTEGEVKEVLCDEEFKREIIQTAPPDPRGSIHFLYPDCSRVEATDLAKVTIKGDEAWEYRDEQNQWCIYMWEDPDSKERITHVGPCVAD